MNDHHYAWLIWASAFLIPWGVLFAFNRPLRRIMWWTSLATMVTGFTEPLFVPKYWNPPSLFNLAQRTGFDVESFIFAFAVGGIGAALYNTVLRQSLFPVLDIERARSRHRFHRVSLLVPYVAFILIDLAPGNPIYAAIAALFIGAITSAMCRPDLARKMLGGGVLFFGLYSAFIFGLRILAPGYIAEVWNLAALRGGLVAGVPVEELLFGLAFGMYWTSVYEHFTWHGTARPAIAHA